MVSTIPDALFRHTHYSYKAWNTDVASVGRRYGVAILLFVSLMLILREAYLAATTGNIVKVSLTCFGNHLNDTKSFLISAK